MTTKRFNCVFNEENVRDFIHSAVPVNTRKHDDWAKKLWSDWSNCREPEPNCDKPPSLVDLVRNKDDVNKWVTLFILEVRNTNGQEYNPATLKCLTAAVQRLLRANGYDGPGLLSHDSPIFSALNAKLKDLKSKGIGLEIKRSDCVQIDDEKILWEKKVLDMNTSKGLLNSVFFYNGKVLALRGRSEHYELQIEQFRFKTDSDGKCFVEFWPMVRKNDQGTIKHSKIRKESIKQYDTDEDNSYYKIINKYIMNLPVSFGRFYHRPIKESNGPRYSNQILGINTIGSMLKKMFDEAGIVDGRRITNHGLRATATTTMFEAGFSQRTISLRTGHLSNAVNGYIRDSKTTHLAISNCLEPVKLMELHDDEKDKHDKRNEIIDDLGVSNESDSTEVSLQNDDGEDRNEIVNELDELDADEDRDDDDNDDNDDDQEDEDGEKDDQINVEKSETAFVGQELVQKRSDLSMSKVVKKAKTKTRQNHVDEPFVIELQRGSKKLKIRM